MYTLISGNNNFDLAVNESITHKIAEYSGRLQMPAIEVPVTMCQKMPYSDYDYDSRECILVYII